MAAWLAGICTVVTNVVVPGRLMLCALYKDLCMVLHWDDNVCMSKKATGYLLQFAKHLHMWNMWHGRALQPPTTDIILYTDASGKGWVLFWRAKGQEGHGNNWSYRTSTRRS